MIDKKYLLLLKVDQIFVIVENFDVCKCSPRILNLFSSYSVFGFLCNLSASLLVSAPSPLYLNSCNVIHSEPMVLEKPTSQWHLISGLDQTGTKVSHALLLVLGHHIESRGQKFLSEALSCCEIRHGPILNGSINVITNGLLLGWLCLFDCLQKQVVRNRLPVHLCIMDVLHVLLEKETADRWLNLCRCQVLRCHRPWPWLVNNFLYKCK